MVQYLSLHSIKVVCLIIFFFFLNIFFFFNSYHINQRSVKAKQNESTNKQMWGGGGN